MKNFITSLFKSKSKDKKDIVSNETSDANNKEKPALGSVTETKNKDVTAEKVIEGLKPLEEVKLYDVIEKYRVIKDFHSYYQFKSRDFERILKICSYYFIQTSTREIEYILERLERYSLKRQQEETNKLEAWINEKGIQSVTEEFIMSMRDKYDREEITLAEYKEELKKLKSSLGEKFNIKVELKELGSIIFKTRYEPYIRNTVEKLNTKPEEDEDVRINKYMKYFGNDKLIRVNLVRLAMVSNKSVDECKNKIKSIIQEETQKKEQEKERKRLEEEAFKEKQRLENIFSTITEIEAYDLITKFILSIRAEYNDGKMSLETYRENLKNMQDYIHYKKNKLIDLTDLEDIIKVAESKVYLEDFKCKLGIETDSEENEMMDRYISYFGSRVFSGENMSKLGALLSQPSENIEKLIQKRQEELAVEAKMKSFENALNGKKQQYTLDFIDNLNGYEFEDYLAELFEDFGYEIERTSYSGDFGADLIIKDKNFKAAIQAKKYTGNVGNKAVQEIVSAMSYYKCDKSIVITNSYYTNQAIELARTTDTTLIDRDGLEKIINKGKMYFIENYL